MTPHKLKRLKKILLELIESVEIEDKVVKQWTIEKYIEGDLKEFLR